MQKIVQFGIEPEAYTLAKTTRGAAGITFPFTPGPSSSGSAGMTFPLTPGTSSSGNPAADDKLIPDHHSLTIPEQLITNLIPFTYFYLSKFRVILKLNRE
jgi:hypothetical protein